MYPIKFENLYYERIWGGRDLEKFRDNVPEGCIGESWDIACHRNGTGIIENGELKGLSFKELIDKYGEEVVAGTQMNNVKFIKPVFPGNTLYVIAEITNKKSIKKENGLVTVSLSTYNENEEIVFKGEVTALINNS